MIGRFALKRRLWLKRHTGWNIAKYRTEWYNTVCDMESFVFEKGDNSYEF